MTIYLPLDASTQPPAGPAFLRPPSDPDKQLHSVTKAILKARRVAVVCGAGISVQAGIPDFRSPEGLFKTLKRENPKEQLTSGKDLFDASVFSSESTTNIFCQMMGHLSEMSQAAAPTPFHQLLKALDDRGKLLRVYTQNIDALEAKCGLTFGVPEFDDRRQRSKAKQSAAVAPPTPTLTPTSTPTSTEEQPPPPPPCTPEMPTVTGAKVQTRLPSPPAEMPRCIPLHGTLQKLHCLNCAHTFDAEADHVRELRAGRLPTCEECTALDETRALIGKRSRGIGRLRPSVVLYNEPHAEGERVGEAVRRDALSRRGADLLLVVGTSLKVPGTKRVVREFARAVRGPPRSASGDELPTPSPSPRATPPPDAPVRTIYLNLDFPSPTREWEGVFDVWLNGDAQTFASMMREAIAREEFERRRAEERRRQREADAAAAAAGASTSSEAKKVRKRKAESAPGTASGAKRQKTVAGAANPKKPQPTKTTAPRKRPSVTSHPKTDRALQPLPSDANKSRGAAAADDGASLKIKLPPLSTKVGRALPGPEKGLIPEIHVPSFPGVGYRLGGPLPSPLTPPSDSLPLLPVDLSALSLGSQVTLPQMTTARTVSSFTDTVSEREYPSRYTLRRRKV